jgi:hypothetical protein
MNNIFQEEQWQPLHIANMDTTERYEVSNFGRIKNFRHSKQGDVFSPSNIKGYPIINIKLTNGKRTTKYIHKMVAEAFLTKTTDLQKYVIHIDYNKDNNHVNNLKWVDRNELYEHQAKNPNYKKGIVRYSKLTETDVIRLKKKLKRGKNPLYKIAKEFGITHTQLNRIRTGENWGHIKVE